MLAQQCSGRSACGTQLELSRSRIDNSDIIRQRWGQRLMDEILECGFTLPPMQKVVE
jgi:hypothetical protein